MLTIICSDYVSDFFLEFFLHIISLGLHFIRIIGRKKSLKWAAFVVVETREATSDAAVVDGQGVEIREG